MYYNDFCGLKLSALGLGCMRFPTDENGKIDLDKTEELVDLAIAGGVNYFDTAWVYHSTESERVIGKLLSKYPRESYCLATKYPGFNADNFKNPDYIFNEQLNKCGVDYFDFYLFHNVNENNIDLFLSEEYGVYKYLVEKKKEGKIKHLGFSTHGTLATVKRFIDALEGELEFCQIQLNYIDYDFQLAKEKVKLLNSKNIPIWVMEPLRGGKLASIENSYLNELNASGKDYSAAEWAFRFLQSTEGVCVTLSGMTTKEVLFENLKTFDEKIPLTKEEKELLLSVGKKMTGDGTLPCTACGYCADHCPKGLTLPWIVGQYNEMMYTGGGKTLPWQMRSLKGEKSPLACIECHACDRCCPQGIKVSGVIDTFSKMLKSES